MPESWIESWIAPQGDLEDSVQSSGHRWSPDRELLQRQEGNRKMYHSVTSLQDLSAWLEGIKAHTDTEQAAAYLVANKVKGCLKSRTGDFCVKEPFQMLSWLNYTDPFHWASGKQAVTTSLFSKY